MLQSRWLLVAVLLAACSDPQPVDQNQRGELVDGDRRHPQDNSPMDEYPFEVANGWQITVDMHSDVFDTYLHLVDPSGNVVSQNDDREPGNTHDSRIQHTAATGGTWKVWANSYDANGRGAYTVHIVARGQ
ncbi:MAG: PPC domain-containing protein [Sandaracinaceae bacterium]|nr:PPC domain-containing protein [Sandaracinaceae bacterium]